MRFNTAYLCKKERPCSHYADLLFLQENGIKVTKVYKTDRATKPINERFFRRRFSLSKLFFFLYHYRWKHRRKYIRTRN